MSDDLVLKVKVDGADAAAAGVDKVGASVTRTAGTWDKLKAKLGSGEVLRNAAASAALLGTGAGGATLKIAALGGALAAIPGPVGLIASAVAVGATVLDTFAKSAENAEKEAADLAKTLADLGKQKLEAQGALAERIGGAVGKGGKDLRAFAMTPGAGQYKGAFDALMPGNGPGAAAAAAQLAASNASDEEKTRALDILAAARNAGGPGSETNTESIAKAIAVAMEATPAFGGTEQEQRQALLAKELALAASQERGGGMSGLGFGFEGRRVATDFQVGQGALDVLGGAGSGVEAAGRRVSAAESPLGKVINDLLAKGEAPAVAEGGRLWADAMEAGSRQGGEALRLATEKAADSTNLLRISIDRLDTTIREKAGGASGAPITSDADQTFNDATSYGRAFAQARNRE